MYRSTATNLVALKGKEKKGLRKCLHSPPNKFGKIIIKQKGRL